MGRKLIPSKFESNDVVMTPDKLCQDIVDYFSPSGKCLDPCKGDGAFIRAFEKKGLVYDWCEITEGKDFFSYSERVDWTITNFPYSIYRAFLNHSMAISDNIVTLSPLNHVLGTKARMRDITDKGFFIREIILIDTPKTFPTSGFQCGVIYLNKKDGKCEFRDWRGVDY